MIRKHAYALILFARDPVMGRVKTRLSSHLDERTILNLYKSFLDDSLEMISKVTKVDHFCGVYPASVSGYFDTVASSRDVIIFPQEGVDLGERMMSAMAKRFEEGYEKVVIIGADSPSLPVSYIERAFASEKDLIIGPSTDSGYYLIGANGHVHDVFTGVPWGTEKVLPETLARVKRIGATLEALPVWYDVDRYEDLLFLKAHLDLLDACGMTASLASARFFKQWEF